MLEEGYVLHTYGALKYLKHAVANVTTLRRHDRLRPVALYCPPSHRQALQQHPEANLFNIVGDLPSEHHSITGFKLNLHRYMPFKCSLFVDSDIVWCRPMDMLWNQLSAYPFTATGRERADPYFGGPKDLRVIWDFIIDRRQKTLKRFGLTNLPRVQAGMIYARDRTLTQEVCLNAQSFIDRIHETHFRRRTLEGRTEESCEWALAMAMSKLRIQVYPWMLSHNSPQLDYISGLTSHSEDFEDVRCMYYCDRFVYDIRGLKNHKLRDFCFKLATTLFRRQDHLIVTPFALHFGWLHEKSSFEKFSERVWNSTTNG